MSSKEVLCLIFGLIIPITIMSLLVIYAIIKNAYLKDKHGNLQYRIKEKSHPNFGTKYYPQVLTKGGWKNQSYTTSLDSVITIDFCTLNMCQNYIQTQKDKKIPIKTKII